MSSILPAFAGAHGLQDVTLSIFQKCVALDDLSPAFVVR
jgi:hypothetical protein